ncbi:protein of unknown function [Streptomyces murinus]
MRRIEGVGDLVEDDAVAQADQHMLGEVQRAQVLEQDVAHVGAAEVLAAPGGGHLVVLGRDDRVVHPGHGVAARVELGEEGGAGYLVGEAGGGGLDQVGGAGEVRQQVGQAADGGSVVVGGDADERVDLGRAAEELQVVAGHHAALGVPDQVDLGGAGGGAHLVHEGGELRGRLVDGAEPVEDGDAGELAVVQGEDAVPAGLQVGGEAEPVVDRVAEGAVDQHDGAGVRGGRLAGVVVPAAVGGGVGVRGRGGQGDRGGGQQQRGEGSEYSLPGQHRVISLRLKGDTADWPCDPDHEDAVHSSSYGRVASGGSYAQVKLPVSTIRLTYRHHTGRTGP